jgi:hypothetical protein
MNYRSALFMHPMSTLHASYCFQETYGKLFLLFSLSYSIRLLAEIVTKYMYLIADSSHNLKYQPPCP